MEKPLHLQPWIKPEEREQLLTPQVIVHSETLLENIKGMAKFAQEHRLLLRPHLKTHKTAEILQLQLKHGAIGLTVAKISEAEEIMKALPSLMGNFSILLAFPPVGKINLVRITELQNRVEMILMIDSLEQAQALNDYAINARTSFSVILKINTGLNRCGIEPDEESVLSFVQQLLTLQNMRFVGLMTHAGHSYGASTEQQVTEIGTYEGETLVKLGKYLERKLNLQNLVISVGSTPTVRISGAVTGVNEVRPGNYVFYDKTQVSLGSASWNQCALRVISRVVSHPSPKRWIVDAGAKTLALDQGAHGKSGLAGFGEIVGHPDLHITRLSEEHGVLEGHPYNSLGIGDMVEIIPNHACPVVNLAQKLLIIDDNKQTNNFSAWNVVARGKNY
jgi:D-serine deaminase-like pyridoxal phosphate-dependent protein